jgi:SAM-dependent methyltransferase
MLYLATEALPDRGSRVLHFAPEQPLERRLRFTPCSEYRTADIQSSSVDLSLDIQQIPLADGSVDLVLCSHVLEHVRDDRRALAELRRVCARDGRVLVQLPLVESEHTTEDLSDLDPKERKRRFGETDHWRLYGRDATELLRAAGFAVTEVDATSLASEAQRTTFGLSAAEKLFVCRPQPRG